VIAWLKLLRLPNVFTAVADVMMGYLVAHRDLEPAWQFALFAAASCLLYLSGMVLNDVFDADVDAREQPQRPIPSGRISLRTAAAVGWAMLASGVLVGWFISFSVSEVWPGVISTLLASCIVLYDRILKRTPVGPLAMGACRMLNVLFGMSLVYISKPTATGELLMSRPWLPGEWLIAIGIGIYVAGVTIFARTDATTSSRPRLIGGLVVLLAGIGLLAAIPALSRYPSLVVREGGWYLLWAVLALITARRCVIAILDPGPQRVQAAVRHCVQSIIVLDAAVCVGFAGPFWGMAVVLLLVPTLGLTLWLDAT
jgi:4-hydroxybenzoate polyprenyltransferase